MARSPRCRSRGATAAVLCGADLRRPRRRRTAAALRRRAPGRLQPPPAHRQGLRAAARAQRADTGLGPALGPSAAKRASERFQHFGYALVQGRSDWVFGPDDRAIQDALFAGWAELGPLTTGLSADEIAGWLAQRRAHLAAG